MKPSKEALLAVAAQRALPDPAHDYQHVLRVVANAQHLAEREHANVELCVAAAALHELFNYPKGHPDSKKSGEVCADHAKAWLREQGVDKAFVQAVTYAIAVHPFSLGIQPTTLEAKILQDADRPDAIGAIGIARCFATCAEMKRPFYSIDDPMCRKRLPNDKDFGVDHFFSKLVRIPEHLNTATARAMAEPRIGIMRAYLAQFESEITP